MSVVHPQRAYELDILRGLASLFVVIHHWRFLFFPHTFTAPDFSALPLANILSPAYLFGERGVDLFFSISGYVFFWLYADNIASGKVSLGSFFHTRFARLYPLFFITLIATAGLQYLYKSLNGQFLIYTDNSGLDFIRNLFLVQAWSYEGAQSFNGPAWSISIEALLYILFFTFCRLGLTRPIWILAAVVAGVWARGHAGAFAIGLPSFFLGGLSFYIVRVLGGRADRFKRPLMLGVAILWIVTFLRSNTALVTVTNDLFPPPLQVLFSASAFWGLLTPLTLVALVMAFRDRQTVLKPYAWLGNISYSVYLLHFPLMLLVSLWLSQLALAMHETIAGSPWFMAGFFAVLIGLSKLCHDHVEIPLRDLIRSYKPRTTSVQLGSQIEREMRKKHKM